jgi:hypothetical protein
MSDHTAYRTRPWLVRAYWDHAKNRVISSKNTHSDRIKSFGGCDDTRFAC